MNIVQKIKKLLRKFLPDSFYRFYYSKKNKLSRLEQIKKELSELKKELSQQKSAFNTLKDDYNLRVRLNFYDYVNKEKLSSIIEKFHGFGLNEKHREDRVIVSLTSYPDRIYDIHYTLYSLLSQTFKPDKVVLWLAKEQFPNGEQDIPERVLTLQKSGLSIKWCDDIKSYKKLIPSLKEYPDDIIVTADDNIFYGEKWLEELMFQYDGENIICHRAYEVDYVNNVFKPYSEWVKCIQSDRANVKYMPASCGGTLYPPHSLHSDTCEKNLFMKLAPNCDDLWFWSMAVLGGKKIKIVPSSNKENGLISQKLCYVNPRRELGLLEEGTLYHSDIVDGNDNSLENILAHYPELGNILENERVPAVSIVIPVYNVENYLSECLESAINQTYSNIEMICVNDGSTDASLEILHEYATKDSRIKIIDKPNGGYGHAMNVGIAATTGDFIAILESDDYISTDAYAKLFTIAAKQDIDIIKAGCYFVYDDNKKKVTQPVTYNKLLLNRISNPIDDKELFHIRMENVLGLFKRDFIVKNDIKFNETPGASHQDVGFWLQTTVLANRFYLIDNCFYHYRQGREGASMSEMIGLTKYQDSYVEYNYAMEKLKKHPERLEAVSDAVWHRRFGSANYVLKFVRKDLKLEAVNAYSKSFADAYHKGLISNEQFSEQEYEDLVLLVENPSQYCYEKYRITEARNKGKDGS